MANIHGGGGGGETPARGRNPRVTHPSLYIHWKHIILDYIISHNHKDDIYIKFLMEELLSIILR